jgi:ATP phosphoribosyltransferase regulatory subunit
MRRQIHTPEGVRDIYGVECDRKRYLERRIEKLLRSFGYQSVETPSFEFFDVFGKDVGTIASRNLYKFFDHEGETLVLRPDFTPSIARAVSMYFHEEQLPLRLCYRGSVFINSSSYQGRLRESTQMGVELINDDSPAADAELTALVVSIMRRAGLTEFQVSLGQVDYFDSLVEEAGMDEETEEELRKLLTIKNRFGAEELIGGLHLRKDLEEAFRQIPGLFGGREVLDRARKLTENHRARAAVDRLQKIAGILDAYGCSQYVSYDLSMLSKYRYYTGIILQAYTYGTGDAVIKGGRYDRLLEKFGKSAPAVGFTTEIDSLLNAIERQNIRLPLENIKTMALYPERLESLAVRFASAHREQGMDVACVRFEPGRILDDYRAYGLRNQFGGIVYFRSEEEVYAINLATGQVSPVDVSAYRETPGENAGRGNSR